MSTITYQRERDGSLSPVSVYVDGKQTGTIKPVTEGGEVLGYRYHCKDSQLKGEIFPTIVECKRSLEDE